MPGMLELTLRIMTAMLVVVGLLWGLVRLSRGPLLRRDRAVSVLARQQVGRGSAIAVVRVADRALVLGVTDHQVTLLTEADLAVVGGVADGQAQEDGTAPEDGTAKAPGTGSGLLDGSALSPQTWRQALNVLRERTVRR